MQRIDGLESEMKPRDHQAHDPAKHARRDLELVVPRHVLARDGQDADQAEKGVEK